MGGQLIGERQPASRETKLSAAVTRGNKCVSSGSFDTDRHSIGSMKSAFRFGRDSSSIEAGRMDGDTRPKILRFDTLGRRDLVATLAHTTCSARKTTRKMDRS